MIKGLKAFEILKQDIGACYEDEMIVVENHLLTLDIIISKRVDMWTLIGAIKQGYKDHELLRGYARIPLTLDEIKLIKGLIEL